MELIEKKLKQLKLSGMSRTWQSLEQTRRVHELSFADGEVDPLQHGND